MFVSRITQKLPDRLPQNLVKRWHMRKKSLYCGGNSGSGSGSRNFLRNFYHFGRRWVDSDIQPIGPTRDSRERTTWFKLQVIW